MNMVEQTTQTNADFAKRMQVSAIWLLVLGIIGTMGLTELLTQLNVHYQELLALLRFISRVATFFALPLSAALLAGAMIVRRLPERE